MNFVALLRGINVGGKNRVSMTDLKTCFEEAGFSNVTTYINSGNVLFESNEADLAKLVTKCEEAIEGQFGFHVVCAVISAIDLVRAIDNAPQWWNKEDAKHDALFVIAPNKAVDVMREVGDANPEYEKVGFYEPVIFWSAPIKTFSRTRYSKIAGTKSYKSVTIRNANTANKLALMCQEATRHR
jgi:uncharacterized protein (DUF1697 family)